jgi:hypothetical protein
MNNLFDSLRQIALTFWIGGLWVVGALVAPLLFRHMDTAAAGAMAGHIFTAMAWVGIVCGLYLLLHTLLSGGLSGLKASSFWLVAVMLLLTAINYFAIHPWITQLKQQAGHMVEGLFGGGFATAHAISSLLYLLECVLGLVLVTRSSR